MNKKRQMWIQACALFAAVWVVLGLFAWPLLILAVFAVLMILIPVGVSENDTTRKHDPEAWRTEQKRPWR